MALGRKKFISEAAKREFEQSWVGTYTRLVKKNSLIWFGIPVFASLLVGTHVMTQFAALRYEKHDRHALEVDQQTAFENTRRRKLDMKEEFYRMQQLDLDNWENKRVKRLPGESENKW